MHPTARRLAAAADHNGSKAKTIQGQIKALGGAAMTVRSFGYWPHVKGPRKAPSFFGIGGSLWDAAQACRRAKGRSMAHRVKAWRECHNEEPKTEKARRDLAAMIDGLGLACLVGYVGDVRPAKELAGPSSRPRIKRQYIEAAQTPGERVSEPSTGWSRGPNRPRGVPGEVTQYIVVLAYPHSNGRSFTITAYGMRGEESREVALPAGWKCRRDSMGLRVQDAQGRDHHLSAENGMDCLGNPARGLALIEGAMVRQAKIREQQDRDAAQAKGEDLEAAGVKINSLTVRIQDSIAAGNCWAGTIARAERSSLGHHASVRAILLAARETPDYADRAKRAVAARFVRARRTLARLAERKAKAQATVPA
jgi:hypothetical protein